MTQQELCERAAKVLGFPSAVVGEQLMFNRNRNPTCEDTDEFVLSEDLHLTNLNILIPEVERWCKNSPMFPRRVEVIYDPRFVGHWTVILVVFITGGTVECRGRDDALATAILKAIVEMEVL